MARGPAQKSTGGPDFFSKVAKLKKGAKVGILMGVVIAALALFYYMYYSPWQAEVAVLEGEVATLEQSVKTEQQNINKHNSIKDYIQPVELTHDYLKRFLTNEDEIPRLIQIISDLGSQAGARVMLFAPKPAEPRTDYAEIEFTMNLEGQFVNVLKFFYSLSQMDRLINITSVNMSTPVMTDNRVMMLTVQCQGSTYRVLTPDEASKAAAK
ncbi:MAG: type 4a pilus biogenesis protein PilO [Deltaproteobacteria bacterium]|jgi:Tfp pilus assembly protein PilO|nr:type 4a pilus biogenesis protein PilO [Deltaproteobacteria bacterium]